MKNFKAEFSKAWCDLVAEDMRLFGDYAGKEWQEWVSKRVEEIESTPTAKQQRKERMRKNAQEVSAMLKTNRELRANGIIKASDKTTTEVFNCKKCGIKVPAEESAIRYGRRYQTIINGQEFTSSESWRVCLDCDSLESLTLDLFNFNDKIPEPKLPKRQERRRNAFSRH